MSEIRRRGRRPAEPQLNVPQREDAELEALSGRLEQLNQESMNQGTMPAVTGRAVRTEEEEQAYNMGARMGAQALAGTGGGQQPRRRIDQERIQEAEKLLLDYKKGKASIDNRIIKSQEWWKLRNWEQIENDKGIQGINGTKGSTAWLWNAIVGKHAEAMDSFPETVVLPRMEDDKAEAQILSKILPVIMQMNGYEEQYSKGQWQKFLEGTAAYHVGWDKTKLGGLGDVSIKNISLLNLFWEPGIDDIQDSENVFFLQIVDKKTMEQQFPQLKGKLDNNYLRPSEYHKDDSVPMDNKCVVVDWYYHTWVGMKKVLQYCQFVNREILYSTEDEGPDENGIVHGLYDDGEYPFVLDPLYPVQGSPAGYGLIDICRDAQTDIDTLNQALVMNAVVTSTPRWFVQDDGAVNLQDYADWRKPFVPVTGAIDERNIREIVTHGIQGNALAMMDRKIEELKFVSGNTDVQNGNTPAGVTAASAIAALQEYSGRGSKDSTRGGYRAHAKISNMTIERLRQFYTIPRWFRILGEAGQEEFIQYSNEQLKAQQLQGGMGMQTGYRLPVFDLDVRSQRETAYTKLSQNELAIQFMQLGVFNPQMTDQVMMMLDMMDFRGKDELMGKVEQQGTLMQQFIQVSQIALALASQYDPETAEMLAPMLQGMATEASGVSAAAGAQKLAQLSETDAATAAPAQENTLVRNARARANQATQPE